MSDPVNTPIRSLKRFPILRRWSIGHVPITKLNIVPWLAVVVLLLTTGPAIAQDNAKRLVALLDYLGSDYKNAVQDGKILSPDEYGEMQEFAKRSLDLFTQLKEVDKADKAGVESSLKSLASQVDSKADPKVIAELAKTAKDKLIAAYNIVPYPRRLPSLAAGKKIYDENCAQCHGVTGKGDGPGRESMNPKTPLPANFADPERIGGLSPFKAFNAASFGIEGTAMASFAALSDEQRWQVAFYVFSLRFSEDAAKKGAELVKAKKLPPDLETVATLAIHSDDELLEKLKPVAANEANALNMLAYLRRGPLETKTSDPLGIAREYLRESVEFYKQGNKEKAYQKAVDAYIDGYDLAEPAIFAKDMTFGRNLETQFTEFRNAIKQEVSINEIQKRHVEMEAKLEQAEQILTPQDHISDYYTFINSALIILREGLEASLILAAIFAMLKVMGAKDAVRYIHLGWIMALVMGGLTWLTTQTVLTLRGQHRESMEGFISIFAALALFYVGYWLHTRSETKKWQAFIQDKVKSSLSSKSIFGLMGISFFAVYREAFEVVLFYQALWLQNENSHHAVLWGFFAGLAALIVLTLVILKLGLRVPLKYFFGVTGTLLYIVAFIFAGVGIKELQAAGWVPTTPIDLPLQVPILGIYPTVQTLTAQAIMLCAFVVTSLRMAKEGKKA
ncbi:MAG TPA: cytochrome c/FTR1 family iron permease [Candidatus Binatia bacterium]|nr:cytochrome c/FTR1 family iron permease [Candidatus Binatia bacterium]